MNPWNTDITAPGKQGAIAVLIAGFKTPLEKHSHSAHNESVDPTPTFPALRLTVAQILAAEP
jgi:hypothetical protein